MNTRNGKKLASVIGAVCATVLTLSSSAAQAATAESDHSDTLAALKAFQAAAGPGAAVHAGNGSDSRCLSRPLRARGDGSEVLEPVDGPQVARGHHGPQQFVRDRGRPVNRAVPRQGSTRAKRPRKLASVIGAVCATVLTLSSSAAQAATAESDHSDTLAALKAFQAAAGPGA
ncbi:hypothetical protein EAO68_38315, partial [Streptomyces sp. wa22]